MFRIDWVEGTQRELSARKLLKSDISVDGFIELLSEGGEDFGAGSVTFDGNVAYIALFVSPGRRKEGFGDLLLRTALLKCAQAGAHAMELAVPKPLAAWPQKLGFTDTGKRDEKGFARLSAYPEDIEWSKCCQ